MNVRALSSLEASTSAPSTQSIAPVKPLRLGRHIEVFPLIAAPMAGISNAAYRKICQSQGAGMCVSEMVVASTLVANVKESQRIATFDPSEHVRAAQLYATRPDTAGKATDLLVHKYGAQTVDLNYGCPVRKVTAKGGGAALAARPALLGSIVRACVQAAGPDVPVTIKIRVGLSDALPTYLDAALYGQDAGAAAVTLHARTAEEQYIPGARWEFIRRLKEELSVPVIGNGDVYTADDAVRMLRETGCDAVMVGRGSLGRPWVFQEIAAVLRGVAPPPTPTLAVAVDSGRVHFEALAEHFASDRKAALEMRKLWPLYLLGFESAQHLKRRLSMAQSEADVASALLLQDWEPTEPFNLDYARFPRLKGDKMKRQKVSLPPNWLDGRLDSAVPQILMANEEACEG